MGARSSRRRTTLSARSSSEWPSDLFDDDGYDQSDLFSDDGDVGDMSDMDWQPSGLRQAYGGQGSPRGPYIDDSEPMDMDWQQVAAASPPVAAGQLVAASQPVAASQGSATNDWGVDASAEIDSDDWNDSPVNDAKLDGWHGELAAPAPAAPAPAALAPVDDAADLAAWQQTEGGRSLAAQGGSRDVYPFGYTQPTGNRTLMQTMRQSRGAQLPRYPYDHQTIAGVRPQRPQQHVGWID